jgi:iron complex outermembrane receptor protein
MNKRTVLICLTLFYLIPCAVPAQEPETARDTVLHLPETVVEGMSPVGVRPNRHFSVGSQALRYGREEMMMGQGLSVSDYLQANTPVYFKEYGKGMVATISLRGTAASQTAVLWNGLDINMPTMGQTDFNLLPLFFFDGVEVHRSGESALYGNGAIGGCIQLITKPEYRKGVSIDLRQSVGSYGYLFSGLGVRLSGKRWESRTQALYTDAKNNFPFRNTTVYGAPEERLHNAGFTQYGLIQEAYFRPAVGHELSLRAWYTGSEREVQPHISLNNAPDKYTAITDRMVRLVMAYNGSFGRLKTTAHAGYTYDYELFEQDLIAMHKALARAEAEYGYRGLLVKGGVQAEYIRPEVHAYAHGTDEWRSELFLLARWLPSPKWALSGGLRKTLVSGVSVPLSPSLSLAYLVCETGRHELRLRSTASINTKTPTLNDRHWGGLGVDLLPETGHNAEVGLDYAWVHSSWGLRTYATGYYNRVRNWIRWLPRGLSSGGLILRPQNIPLVDAYGAELGATVETTLFQALHLEGQGHYAYTAVVLREAEARANSYNIGRQVAYQPRHAASVNLKISFRNMSLRAGVRYTGKRHNTDYYDTLPAYWLTDLQGGYTFSFKNTRLTLMAQVNNLFDVAYQSMHYYVMPGRTFTGTITLKL